MRGRAIALVAALALAVCAGIVVGLIVIVHRDARRIDALLVDVHENFARTVDIVRMDRRPSRESPMERGREILAELEPLLERRRKLRLDCSAYDERLRIVKDMAVYDAWIQADTKVRDAKIKKDLGDLNGARRLLLEALACPELGPDARASIKRRLALWGLER